jgi:hypothetical protein
MAIKKFNKYIKEDYEIFPVAVGEFTAEVAPEQLPEEVEEVEEVEPTKEVEQSNNISFIEKMLYFDNQIRLWHVLTQSYAEHKALQELYEQLNSDIDDLLELYVKKFGRFDPSCLEPYNFQAYDKETVRREIDQFVELCKQLKEDFSDSAFDNLLDDMIQFCTKIGYLLTLESADPKN